MPTMERRIPISESKWEQQQAAKPSHTTPSKTAALAIMKYDDNDNIAPTVSSECMSDIDYYPAPAQPAADDDTPRRADDTTSCSSAASCPVANTPRSTTSSSDDADEEDSDEEIGAMIYASSKTARARRAVAEAASAVTSNQSPSSYKPRSEVGKRKSLSNSSSHSKDMESVPKKNRILKSFEQRMDDLRAYKEKHGHVNMKKRDDKSLYEFCINMRRAHNNPEKSTAALTDDRVASLDALDFDWVTRNSGIKSFEQRMDDLRAYKEKHGHVNVKQGEDKSLYDFCRDIRYARKHPEKSDRLINEERIASLDALGFDWSVSERKTKKTFDQRVADLQAYKEKHGHVNVKKSDDTSLYLFCGNTRHTRNNPGKSGRALTDDRIASLDALGFDWAVNEQVARKSFEQRMDDLREYKEKNGHVNVKQRVDKSLYDFCRDMRRARKHPEKSDRALTDKRIASLDALGFDWTVNEHAAKKSFEQRLEELRVYKEKNGHVNVKKSKDESLYAFCSKMRHARNNLGKYRMILTDDHIASLAALGFDWRMR